MKNWTFKFIFFLSLFFCALFLIEPVSVLAYSGEIRVGLKSMYSDKKEIKIYNTALYIGYFDNGAFDNEARINSETGFVFVPAQGYYIDLGETYEVYSTAVQKAAVYKKYSEKAVVAVNNRKSWKVYMGPFDEFKTAETLLNEVKTAGFSKAQLLGNNNYRVMLTGASIGILIDVDEDYMYPEFMAATSYNSEGNFIDLGSRVYRGRIQIGTYGLTTLTAVNIVPLEEYLYGVVPCEMPSSWPKEALKAQAVCARSFAMVKASMKEEKFAQRGYKIVDTIESQVYRGYLAEEAKTTNAVKETEGKTVTYNNKVVATYYFSSSGGVTESSEDVWGIPFSYLQSVEDKYERNYATEPWKVELTWEQLTKAVQGYSSTVGPVNDVKITQYTGTGRVSAIRLIGEGGSITFQTSAIRNALGLKGTKFNIVRAGDNPDRVTAAYAKDSQKATAELDIADAYVLSAEGTSKIDSSLQQYVVKAAGNLYTFGKTAPLSGDSIYIYGLGSGHGVGMSQSGAAGMAAQGKSYTQIIEYYFKGCRIS